MIRILVFLTTLVFLLGFGYHQLINTIYHSMNCYQYNIDHIELRTGVDVPRTLGCDCNLSKDRRLARFELSRGLMVSDYVSRNDFHEEQDGWLVKSGESESTRWTSRLDTSNYVLEFDLVYLDESRL